MSNTLIKQSNTSAIMSFPEQSFNNRARGEARWEDDARIYGDVNSQWSISIGNGKRLRRQWNSKGGIAFVSNQRGGHHTIYNGTYDREWQAVIRECKPPKGLTRQVAMDYDRSYQPDGDPEFYYSNQRTTY